MREHVIFHFEVPFRRVGDENNTGCIRFALLVRFAFKSRKVCRASHFLMKNPPSSEARTGDATITCKHDIPRPMKVQLAALTFSLAFSWECCTEMMQSPRQPGYLVYFLHGTHLIFLRAFMDGHIIHVLCQLLLSVLYGCVPKCMPYTRCSHGLHGVPVEMLRLGVQWRISQPCVMKRRGRCRMRLQKFRPMCL